jgi:hypothetical protein
MNEVGQSRRIFRCLCDSFYAIAVGRSTLNMHGNLKLGAGYIRDNGIAAARLTDSVEADRTQIFV